jgi:hypothetical protein
VTTGLSSGGPPLIQLQVSSTRARQVAAPGWAVPDGCVVLDVLAWDESLTPRRPARVRTALARRNLDRHAETVAG